MWYCGKVTRIECEEDFYAGFSSQISEIRIKAPIEPYHVLI